MESFILSELQKLNRGQDAIVRQLNYITILLEAIERNTRKESEYDEHQQE